MGKYYDQLQVKNEIKEKEKIRKEASSKFFYDLAKITFTLATLSGIPALFTDMKSINNWLTICTGFTLTFLLSSYTNNTLKY